MGNIIKPIKPEEILQKKTEIIPDEMIQVVNNLIALKWNGHSAQFKTEEVIEKYLILIKEDNIQINRDKIFKNHYLDFEDIYRKEGWKVKFDKPGYNENYDSFYVFEKK